MSTKGSPTFCLFLGMICFLSHPRLFNYLKSRHTDVQRVLLNDAVRARKRLNSIACNIRFLQNCLENSVALRSIQRRVKKSKVYHSAVIERAYIKDDLEKSRSALHQAKDKFSTFVQ